MIGIDVDLYWRGGHRAEIDEWLKAEGLIDAKVVKIALTDESLSDLRIHHLDLDTFRPGMSDVPRKVIHHRATTPLRPEWLGIVA